MSLMRRRWSSRWIAWTMTMIMWVRVRNSKATNQLGGNGGSKSASETADINGSAGNVNGSTRKREIPPENNNVGEIKSPPKFPRHTTTGSNWPLFNPPENAQDYNAIAQAHFAQAQTRSIDRKLAEDDFKSRIVRRLRSRGTSLVTIKANEQLIELVASSSVNGSDLVPMDALSFGNTFLSTLTTSVADYAAHLWEQADAERCSTSRTDAMHSDDTDSQRILSVEMDDSYVRVLEWLSLSLPRHVG
eukprot:scaffold2321_cov157-Skeletonema_dohrnii-CCMP3373.AAC.1